MADNLEAGGYINGVAVDPQRLLSLDLRDNLITCAAKLGTVLAFLPCLVSLLLNDCRELKGLPDDLSDLTPNLTELDIEGCVPGPPAHATTPASLIFRRPDP